MAAINVVLNGAFTSDTGTSVGTFVGTMAYADRGVGGGPIMPPEGGGKPPSIWPDPGPLPHPEHPIVIPPNKPDVPPPSIWPPGPGIDTPEHPIVLPPPGNPIPPGTLVTWKAVWVPPAVTGGDGSWMIVGVPNVPHPSPS